MICRFLKPKRSKDQREKEREDRTYHREAKYRDYEKEFQRRSFLSTQNTKIIDPREKSLIVSKNRKIAFLFSFFAHFFFFYIRTRETFVPCKSTRLQKVVTKDGSELCFDSNATQTRKDRAKVSTRRSQASFSKRTVSFRK